MGLGLRELLVILLIVLIVFGTKRLISAGGDLGKAIQSFKKGVREAQEPAKLESPTADDALGNTPSNTSSGAPGVQNAPDNQAPGANDRQQPDR